MKNTRTVSSCAVLLITVAALVAATVEAAPPSPATARLSFLSQQTEVTFPAAENGPDQATELRTLHRLVPLPRGTASFTLALPAGTTGRVSSPGGLQYLRGTPMISVLVEEAGPGAVQVVVHHDGSWDSQTIDPRLVPTTNLSGITGAPLPTAQKSWGAPGGTYVIIVHPDFAAAMTPLVEWKQRKGFPVELVTTLETGGTTEDIHAWLSNAYATWQRPPEYVVLVGDIDRIPTWDFSGNVADHPYACVDGDDWLPDLFLGRMSVSSLLEAETVVAKTIAYERTPLVEPDNDWFTRSLMVASNTGSTTPVSTAEWCGEQLETIGFSPATTVFNIFNGTPVIWGLEAGVSIMAYRGWAYGPRGWEPPHFTVDEIPQVDNGAMTPVVFSFVCLTMDFGANYPCFGEVFLRQGSPTEQKGAVAFVGNGEHWSHTRYNDAMAIAFFQRIVDPEIRDLGSLVVAGKLGFMDFFPHEMSAAENGEESVEFYFHIYGLLGDPELNFYRAVPTPLTVDLPATVAVGGNLLDVRVLESDGLTPRPDARVGVVQGDQLLGWAFSDQNGDAVVDLEHVEMAGDVFVTVTHPDRLAYEGVISGTTSTVFLAASDYEINDDASPPSNGNGDGMIQAGEIVEILPTLTNYGSGAASSVTANLAATAPASLIQGGTTFADLGAGGSAAANSAFVLQVDHAAENGTIIRGVVEAGSDQVNGDTSQLELWVVAPDIQIDAVTMGGDGYADPGEQVFLSLVLKNEGSVNLSGGSVALSLADPSPDVTDLTTTFGQLNFGGSTSTAGDPLVLQVASEVIPGSGIPCRIDITTTEGFTAVRTFSLLVGKQDFSQPVGPDSYGYYAFDSADIDFPGQVPTYHWMDISPEFGGDGTEVVFNADNYEVRTVDLPFTFTYYGEDFDQVRISDNGWISFDTGDFYDFYNWSLPNSHGNHSVIAPFWDNLNPVLVDSVTGQVGIDPDGIYHYHDPVAGTFTVEWSRLRHYRPEITDPQTFQVVLYDPAAHPTTSGDGEILCLYRQVSNSDYLRNFATVGIESPSEDDGLQLTYANVYTTGAAPITPGLAVKFTTEPPVYVPFNLAAFAARPAPGGVDLSWSPVDDRPVLGWHVTRLTDDGDTETRLTATPLPADTRSYRDVAAPSTTSGYRLTALHPLGRKTELGPYAAEVTAGPATLALLPAWPNPTRGSTRIGFALPRTGHAQLRVYDLAGRLVRTLLDGPVAAGPGQLMWDGLDQAGQPAAGGVYLYRLKLQDEIQTRKLLLVR